MISGAAGDGSHTRWQNLLLHAVYGDDHRIDAICPGSSAPLRRNRRRAARNPALPPNGEFRTRGQRSRTEWQKTRLFLLTALHLSVSCVRTLTGFVKSAVKICKAMA